MSIQNDRATRVVAVDWSGAASGAERKIWLAEVEEGRVLRLECGRDRWTIAEHLIDLKDTVPSLVVGFDFAFSLPAWFVRERGLTGAPALWRLVADEGERWLSECAPPFWGRPGKGCPDLPEHFRHADREVPPVGGIRPKSVFQIGGAGAVGTGSLRGMPVLARLRDAGFAIWPFDEPRLPLVVEIYPRALTGAVVKGSEAERRRYLAERHATLDEDVVERAAGSEDAFDALVSALVMAEHADSFRRLERAGTAEHRLEGRIWRPDGALNAEGSRLDRPTVRGARNSSRTRVVPVFDALRAQDATGRSWIPVILDLAAGDRSARPWAAQDLTIEGEPRWGSSERALHPPVALLSWLIRQLSAEPDSIDVGSETGRKRRALAERDPRTIEEALSRLRSAGTGKGWHVLEGPSYPDVYLETPDAIVVIEGKRTERDATGETQWMPGRRQMLRHIDGAWEIRGRRAVFGLMIVEGDERGDVPDVWRRAAADTVSDEAIAASLPHRSAGEQAAIRDAFVGITTWQRVCDALSLDRLE